MKHKIDWENGEHQEVLKEWQENDGGLHNILLQLAAQEEVVAGAGTDAGDWQRRCIVAELRRIASMAGEG